MQHFTTYIKILPLKKIKIVGIEFSFKEASSAKKKQAMASNVNLYNCLVKISSSNINFDFFFELTHFTPKKLTIKTIEHYHSLDGSTNPKNKLIVS